MAAGVFVAAGVPALGACAARGRPVDIPVAQSAVERAVRATAPSRPLRVVFDWELREREGRFSGRGVARIEPPYRARLDLFGPRGEGVLTAALVGDELRLPPGAEEARVPIPPPALLWSVLGVFRPPPAELTAAAREDGRLRVEYAGVDGRWRFLLDGDRLVEAEWRGDGDALRRVETNGAAAFGVPDDVVYRNYEAFRQLELDVDQVDEVDSFPAEIWTPGGG